MHSIPRDLAITQGATWSAGWQFTTDGTPLVDSTWTARAQVRATKNSPTVLHEWSTALGTIEVRDDGTVILSVAPATSSAWTWRDGVYDVELTKDGTTHRLIEGQVTVDTQVTR